MLIMSPETDTGSTGGMATLTAAVAHLQTIHQTIDAVDAKAMFYVGLNFVALGIFCRFVGSAWLADLGVGLPWSADAMRCAGRCVGALAPQHRAIPGAGCDGQV